MRRTRTLTNGIKKYVWDVFERPYYTWDIYERDVTSYIEQAISASEMGAYSFDIPFNAGYWYSNDNHTYAFNPATGKYTMKFPITDSTSKGDLSYMLGGNVSTESGQEVSTYLKFDYGDITKNTELHQFEFRSLPAHNNTGYRSVPVYGKGSLTGTTAVSFANNTYPTNGYDTTTELYYVRRSSMTKIPTGNVIKSQYPNAFPALGYDASSGYWYEKRAMS